MQEYRKLLCVNKIRETKRLIENMLIPILSLVVAAAVANYAQTECQFRYCGTAIPFLTVRSTAR